jgi:hypothetical protein
MPHRHGDLSRTSSLQNTSQCNSQQNYFIHSHSKANSYQSGILFPILAASRPVSELRSKNARFALVPPPPQTNLRAEPERSDCRPSWLSEYCLQPSSTFATFSQLQLSDIIPQTIYFFKLVDGTQEATRPSPPVLNNHMQPTPPTRQQPFHSSTALTTYGRRPR